MAPRPLNDLEIRILTEKKAEVTGIGFTITEVPDEVTGSVTILIAKDSPATSTERRTLSGLINKYRISYECCGYHVNKYETRSSQDSYSVALVFGERFKPSRIKGQTRLRPKIGLSDGSDGTYDDND